MCDAIFSYMVSLIPNWSCQLSEFQYVACSYWAIGLHPGGTAFFRFLSFLFLAIYIAEAQSILVASIIPIFVAALAIASFLNGFWMVRISLVLPDINVNIHFFW